jgi:hypothetical protein
MFPVNCSKQKNRAFYKIKLGVSVKSMMLGTKFEPARRFSRQLFAKALCIGKGSVM